MNLWLDDLRPPPSGWLCARTAPEAVWILEQGGIDILSLDHDLGECLKEVGTGHDVALWLEEQARHGRWSFIPRVIRVHSSNPLGAAKMWAVIEVINRMRARRE